jgi:hypothetical protein
MSTDSRFYPLIRYGYGRYVVAVDVFAVAELVCRKWFVEVSNATQRNETKRKQSVDLMINEF